jgi:hypothetical protein
MSDYAEEKNQSEARDLELGFAIAETEAEIQDRLDRAEKTERFDHQTWAHLSPQVFQTPYAELERIVAEADPDESVNAWADLGAAYGRLGIVLAAVRPGARFIGVECVPERVREGRRIYARLHLNPDDLVLGDLRTLPLPEADLYFIYDFGKREAIDSVLLRLRERAKRNSVIVVGRGRGIRDAIEHHHPWLASVTPPIHSAHYSIYRSA